MDLWKSYVQLLAKLQLFTRIGTVVWALPSMLLLIWFCFSRFISFSTVFAAFSVFTVTVWFGFLALIPFCIHGLGEYVELVASKEQGQMPILKAQKDLAPPKLIWFSTAFSLAQVVIQIVMAVKYFDLQDGLLSVTLTTFLMLYTVMFGILFGTISQTLCGELEKIGEDIVEDKFGEAEMLFVRYKVLKKGSKFGLFIIASFCTILVITSSYMVIVVFAYADCEVLRGDTDAIVYISTIVQVAGHAFNFYFFAISADNCYVRLQGMTQQLR